MDRSGGIGQRAKESREALGLSQLDVLRVMQELDAELAPSLGWLRSVESGLSRDPGGKKVDLLAKVLQVDEHWLRWGTGSRKRKAGR